MSSGLLALLDDVSALVKASAASLDDVSTQVAKTSGKVSGILIDDAAVTPKYVIGLSPDREVFIIWSIAKKSLINKTFILSPAALFLGHFLPWSITPLLMLGGAYLCYEGFEKVHSLFSSKKHVIEDLEAEVDLVALEKKRIASAVRTDLILSAEIVAITYSNVLSESFVKQTSVMLGVGILLTLVVYGVVGLIVKADDIGLYFAKGNFHSLVQKSGALVVKMMPSFLNLLSYVGTLAMLLVGFGIIVHGIHPIAVIEESLSTMINEISALLSWFVISSINIVLGLFLGYLIDLLIKAFQLFRAKNAKKL
ncbi:MAG: ABC transporter [Bdellovibrionales bacterium CG12_big_fil_rev_8_21_14_0_65_38_15]|nr:MAG: ABC transporter [Bdellovibrionales bacterium CG22_combo_CG10-13_8_21_14_all_38_13]PIQ56251.1 MAG: ABC transporter [Bdellovibrionales bacterium CG12_big_fil_rev_8_21_14_0_65_38_15]PIR30395.1 MAG: ABC transporter [Bdellovibrionales bacterium CG11_big_fil_rev_8_21_14_0_20_38_13]